MLMDQAEVGGVEGGDWELVGDGEGRQHCVAAQVDPVLFDRPAIPVLLFRSEEEVLERGCAAIAPSTRAAATSISG